MSIYANPSDVILQTVFEPNRLNKPSGRRSIDKALEKNKIHLSDGMLRDELKKLEQEELIIIHRGRAGCKLTNKGIERLREQT